MSKENTKGCYIPSIEAEEIYDMSVRGLENIKEYEYKGQIPFSLELIKLRSYKRLFAEKEIKSNSKVKFESDAIINVKFKNKLKGGKEITSNVRGYDNLISRLKAQFKAINKAKRVNKQLIEDSKNKREQEKLEKSVSYLNNKARLVIGHINRIKADKDNLIYQEVKAPDLREHLYVNGFTFKGRRYVFYKRTASKSRQSNTLFILENLFDRMKEWSHIGLDLTGEIDVASLLAYESLCSSSLESTITINPQNIFIIDDKFSTFYRPAIEVGNDLTAIPNKNAEITNNIWDGQGLIDISLMESVDRGDKGMILTRQHFWKSCLFNSNIQEFLQDKCPKDTPYNEWKLTDMFGNKVYAKDILVISTPSSCKFLKYAEEGKEKEAYANWCKRVLKDKNLFGICKSEKPSKYGDRSYTSYQMINTLDIDEIDITELAQFEVEFIKDLQGRKDENGNFDEAPFIQYLNDKKDLSNAYEMLAKWYEVNPEIVRTQIFREYRSKQISKYRTKVKGGKLRQIAAYCTVVSNPYEMLLSVVNKFDEVKSHTLQGNQVYTTLYDFNESESYVVARNPHNSMNNWFEVYNVDNQLINTYFNFKKAPNIIVISSIENEALDRLNGMDMDSDTLLMFSDPSMKKFVKNTLSNRNYPIILNTIKPKPNPVELTNKNIAEIDEKTAKSQRWIGEITNAAQYQVSVLWDVLHNEQDTPEREEKVKEILGNIAVAVVLSNVAIDYSKKVVEVDIDKALRKIRGSKAIKIEVEETDRKGKVKTQFKVRKKPNFWKYVSSSDVEMEDFNCPMDFLIDHINNDIDNANYRKNLPFSKLLCDLPEKEIKGADDKQIEDIIDLVQQFDKEFKQINAEGDEDKKCQERKTLLEGAYSKLDEKIGKKKIKKATMYKILTKIAKVYDNKGKSKKKDKVSEELSSIAVHLLNALYRNHGVTFLSLIKK